MPKKKNKNAPPPRVRAKNGAKSAKVGDVLAFIDHLLSMAASAAVAPKVATQLAALTAARAEVASAAPVKVKADGDKKTADTAYLAAVRAVELALSALLAAVVVAANGDPTVLGQLGIPAAAEPVRADGPMPVPEKVAVGEGATQGSIDAKCGSVAGAGGYIFQYKLEPSLPADPWLPGNGGAMTKYTRITFTGFASLQAVRVRVAAIGAVPGPWSLEVVGRAK